MAEFHEFVPMTQYVDHCMQCGKGAKFHQEQPLFIRHKMITKQVPVGYNQLLQNFPHDRLDLDSISDYYLEWGRTRFEVGSQQYQRQTQYGVTNQCFLPETDTIKDIEEELLDAFFNSLVLSWKIGNSNPRMQLLYTRIAGALEMCQNLRSSILDGRQWQVSGSDNEREDQPLEGYAAP